MSFNCPVCERAFKSRPNMNRHIVEIHSLDRPCKCEVCGKRFSRKDHMKRHSRTHRANSAGREPPAHPAAAAAAIPEVAGTSDIVNDLNVPSAISKHSPTTKHTNENRTRKSEDVTASYSNLAVISSREFKKLEDARQKQLTMPPQQSELCEKPTSDEPTTTCTSTCIGLCWKVAK